MPRLTTTFLIAIAAALSVIIRATVRAVLAEQTLALRAATKAASPRQNLTEVRAMYVPISEPDQQHSAAAASTTRKRTLPLAEPGSVTGSAIDWLTPSA